MLTNRNSMTYQIQHESHFFYEISGIGIGI
jgi:hypothetical protein